MDDISGWDFLNGDNNPLDDVEYSHGTGEARDSTAEHDGEGSAGTCPECSHLPVRVSDSFIAEGGRFAASVLLTLDSGADVIQGGAPGAISNPPQARQAIDAAYHRGCRWWPPWPTSSPSTPTSTPLEHTIPVNSLTEAPGSRRRALRSAASRRGRAGTQQLHEPRSHRLGVGAIRWLFLGGDRQRLGDGGPRRGPLREAGLAPHPDLAASWGQRCRLETSCQPNEVAQLIRDGRTTSTSPRPTQ
ncbi:MAG: hypothetical protein R2716_05695 [Microthrixaceae bacterium]